MIIEQEGGELNDRYEIESIRQRNIPKFNVKGYEYNVKLKEMEEMNYREAVQLLHHTLERKYG